MNAPSIDIKDLLEDAGVGTFAASSGWAISISREPTSPDTAITIYDTGGEEPLYDGYIEHPTVQIRVRGSNYLNAYEKIKEIKDLLLFADGEELNGTIYSGFWLMGDIDFLEYDESNRPIFVSNYRLMRS